MWVRPVPVYRDEVTITKSKNILWEITLLKAGKMHTKILGSSDNHTKIKSVSTLASKT